MSDKGSTGGGDDQDMLNLAKLIAEGVYLPADPYVARGCRVAILDQASDAPLALRAIARQLRTQASQIESIAQLIEEVHSASRTMIVKELVDSVKKGPLDDSDDPAGHPIALG
jgi:hypothetical protein